MDDGDAGPIVESHAKGAVISIHEAPTREGYSFAYWKGSEYQPGDSYTVCGAFLAEEAIESNHSEERSL